MSSQLNTELVTILARSEHIPKQLQTSNPLHWIVFLWLVYIQPNKLKIHQSNYGYDVYQEIANWLSSTLAWLPIFLVMFGAVLKPKLIFNATDFSVITPAGLCVFVIIAWIITGVKGVKQNNILFFIVFFAASSMTVLITGGTAVFVIGFMVYFIMRVFTYGLTVIAFGGIAVITLGVIIFLIVVGILHDIFNNVISGIPEIVALFLAIGVTDYVANIVISRFKSAKPIRFILIPLILAYGYLIWLYLLGGTSAIWDI